MARNRTDDVCTKHISITHHPSLVINHHTSCQSYRKMKLSVSILFATLGRFSAAFVPFTSASRNAFLSSPFVIQRQRFHRTNQFAFARGGATGRLPQSESVVSLEASPIKSDFRLIAADSSSRDFGGLAVTQTKGFRVIFVLGGPGAGKGKSNKMTIPNVTN